MLADTTYSPPALLQPENVGDWYLVHCKPQREALAAYVLSSQLGLQTYLPEVLRRVRGTQQLVPFFPGYLFAAADLGEVQLSSINAAPGVIRLLDVGGAPQQVPPALVLGIRARLDELNACGFPAHNFSPGDAVRFRRGAWKGVEAIFVGPPTPAARVKVLLDLLGRQNEVQVDAEDLERVQRGTADVQVRRRRTTRGRGRRINGG
ncbi:MAG TPA: transcription termination/antitermination NusG family protein [Chloroflexia bacterium]|jgi:transcription elongation factor/antiterminator RfaH